MLDDLQQAGRLYRGLQSNWPEWSARLQNCTAQCRDIIQTCSDRGRLLKDRGAFKEMTDAVCRQLAEGLYEVLLDIWAFEDRQRPTEHSVTPSSRDFYFWPGYAQYGTTRLDIAGQPSYASLDVLRGAIQNQFHGVGYRNGNRGATFEHFPLSIWYYLLYGQRLDGYRYLGFTSWFSLNEQFYLHDPDFGAEHVFPLNAIEIECVPKGTAYTQPHQDPSQELQALRNGLYRATIVEDIDPMTFSEQLFKQLNNTDHLFYRDRGSGRLSTRPNHGYPFPPIYSDIGEGESKFWSRDDIANLDQEDGRRLLRAAKIAFSFLTQSIFLGGSFAAAHSVISPEDRLDNKTQYHAYIDRCLGELDSSRFSELRQALETGKALYSSSYFPTLFQQRFAFYYVFPIQKTIEIEGAHVITSDIGTMNLYTNRRIPSYCVHLIKPCLDSIYQQVRFVEAALDSQRKGSERQQALFSHQTAGMVDILTDDIRAHPDEVSSRSLPARWTLWNWYILIKEVWSGRGYDGCEHVLHGAGSEFWPFNEAEHLDRLIEFAFLQGYMRIHTKPTKGKYHLLAKSVEGEDRKRAEGKLRLAECAFNRIDDILTSEGGGNDVLDLLPILRRKLNFEVRGRPPLDPPWVQKKGFVLCFHHALWSAVFHAFLAYMEDITEGSTVDGTYLGVEFGPEKVFITNRCARQEWESSHAAHMDDDFFRMLNEKHTGGSRPCFQMSGPERIRSANDHDLLYYRVMVSHSHEACAEKKK